MMRSSTKKAKASQLLEAETKKMEEKLDLVKKMMDLEKDKRTKTSAEGSIWRGATTKKPIKGYSEAVLINYKKGNHKLPPTTLVTETRTQDELARRRGKPSSATASNQFGGISGSRPTAPPKSGGGAGISTNLQNALRFQNEEYSEVRGFLAGIKLDKYFDKFIDNGVEDEETILELEDSHVEQMGIPLGHKLKIMKRIKDMRTSKAPGVDCGADAMAPSTSASATSLQVQTTQTTKKQVKFSEDTKDNKKATTSGGVGSGLIYGAYNEEESHQSFLQALNAWRKGGKEEEKSTPAKKDKKVDLADVEKSWNVQRDTAKKGSFFANLDQNNTDFNLGSIPTWQDGGTQAEKSESCWTCFKIFKVTGPVFRAEDRPFCSQGCLDKYEVSNKFTCSLPGCSKQFFKHTGEFESGTWYCCREHAISDPRLQKLEAVREKIRQTPLKQSRKAESDSDSEEVEIDL